MTIRLLAVAVLWLTAATWAPAAAAQEPMAAPDPAADSDELTDPKAAALDARAAEIAAKLRCPVCSGQSVLESNAPISQEMHKLIRERLERGQTNEEIIAYFRSSYGDWIVLQPRPTGWNLLVYVLPAVVLVAGAGWLIVVLRRWSAGPADRTASAPDRNGGSSELSDDDEEWLQRSIGGA